MIRGTGYAVAEILVWMLLAGTIGWGMGWAMRAWSHRKLSREWERRYDAEHQRAETLERKLAEQEARAEGPGAASAESPESREGGEASVAEEGTSTAADQTVAANEGAATTEHEPDTPGEDATHGSVVGTAAPETTSLADIAVRTRDGAAIVDDELHKIPGVGPELEARLKQLGITSFRQVANLTPDDVVVVTEAVGTYPGRIAHDNWTASAAVEHERKYGEPP